jgi:hypothetical protein
MNREYVLGAAAVEGASQDRMRRELDDLRYVSNTKNALPYARKRVA